MSVEAQVLLDELAQRAHTIRAAGEELRIRPPLVDVALRERLLALKPELLALLKERDRIPAASKAQCLARTLVTTARKYGLLLHAVPDGLQIELPGCSYLLWREVMTALENENYTHEI
jgi:hypothetical protein